MTSAQPGQGAGAPAGRPVEGGPRGSHPRESAGVAARFASLRILRRAELAGGRAPMNGRLNAVRARMNRFERRTNSALREANSGGFRASALVDRCAGPFLHAERRIRLLSSTTFPPLVWISPPDAEIDRNGPLYWGQSRPRGAKRSPSLSRRRKTSSVSKRRSAGSFFAAQRRTSVWVTGVDTVGVDIARTE
jgi:hypothetical protein